MGVKQAANGSLAAPAIAELTDRSKTSAVSNNTKALDCGKSQEIRGSSENERSMRQCDRQQNVIHETKPTKLESLSHSANF